ncbi:MAG: hypothetical protein AB7I57_02655 [Pirellulales bacterium]
MVQNNQLTYRTAAGQMRQAGINAVFAGVLFALMGGIFIWFIGADFGHYLGTCFVVLGVLVLFRGISSMWASGNYRRLALDKPDGASTPNTEQFR